MIGAKWTDAIHDEWMRNVLKDRPDLTPDKLQRTRELMNASALDLATLPLSVATLYGMYVLWIKSY